MRISPLSLLFCLCVILLPGCYPTRVSVLEPPKVKPLPKLDEQSSKKLEAVIESAVTNLKSFRALASVVAEKALGKQELTQTIVFERPENLRMDMFAPGFNQLMGLLLVRNGTVQVLDLQEKTLHVGSADPDNISQVLGVPLNSEAFMALLCGQIVPSTMIGVTKKVFYQKGKDLYLMKLTLDYGIQVLAELSVSAPPLRRAIFHAAEIKDSKTGLLISSSKFGNAEKLMIDESPLFIPNHIELDQVENHIHISIDYKSKVLNPDTSDPRVFSVQIPKNITRYALE